MGSRCRRLRISRHVYGDRWTAASGSASQTRAAGISAAGTLPRGAASAGRHPRTFGRRRPGWRARVGTWVRFPGCGSANPRNGRHAVLRGRTQSEPRRRPDPAVCRAAASEPRCAGAPIRADVARRRRHAQTSVEPLVGRDSGCHLSLCRGSFRPAGDGHGVLRATAVSKERGAPAAGTDGHAGFRTRCRPAQHRGRPGRFLRTVDIRTLRSRARSCRGAVPDGGA